MSEELQDFSRRMSVLGVKILALVVSFVVVLSCIILWRVSQGPLDVGFAKPYIQAALHDPATGNYAKMDRVVLFWPDMKGPLLLQIEGGRLLTKDDEIIISVDTAAISFSRRALLFGRILPKAIILQKPTLRLIREENGDIDLDLGQDDPEQNTDEQFALTTRIFSYIARPGRESAKKSIIARLEAFKIEDARLFVDDRMLSKSWSLPDFNLFFKSTKTGMKGIASVSLPDIGFEQSSLQMELDYIWNQKDVILRADLSNIDLSAVAGNVPDLDFLADQDVILNASLQTVLDETFIPEVLKIDIKSDEGTVFYPDLSDEKVPYKNLSVSGLYHYGRNSLSLDEARITIKDITLSAEADIAHKGMTLKGPVKLSIDQVAQSEIGPLWPKALRGDNSEKWIVQRLSEGTFHDAWLAFDLRAEKAYFPTMEELVYGPQKPSEKPTWRAGFQNLEAEFSYKDMSVDYRSPLTPVKKAYGTGRFDFEKDELTIDIQKAKLGDMSVKGAKLLFDKVVAVGEGDAHISVAIDGKVQDVLHYLSEDPINLDDDINMDIDAVEGQADLNVTLQFPAQSDVTIKDFTIGANGTLNSVLFPDVLDKLDLSGGPLDFKLKDNIVSLDGNALLDKRDIDLYWETFLYSEGKPYKEKVRAKMTADPNIRTQLGIDLSDFIEGSLDVDVDYTEYQAGRGVADVKVDATPAVFFVEPFDYEKPSGKTGSSSFQAHLKNGVLQKITDLVGKTDEFRLAKSNIFFKTVNGETELSHGSAPAFTLGETKSAIDFKFDESGAAEINMKASFIDAQPFVDPKDSSGEYSEPPMRITVTADQMRTAPEELTGATTMYFDVTEDGAFDRVEIDTSVGEGQVHVSYGPDSQGKRVFRLNADDAGAFLKAFQVYNNVKGGSLSAFGESANGEGGRDMKGKAEMKDFTIVKAPFLTKILSIMSLSGIGEVLNGKGLKFDKLEADFNWEYRKGGSLVKIKDGRTSGNTLGLLFDGTYDNALREIDVSGTIAPMSGLNQFIGSIPLVGKILTGGSGGVFAATYSIKGKSDDPEIGVNPLSVVAPGIIRRILFE